MKFRRPAENPGSAPHSPGSFVGKPKASWLKDWIANQGRWVELECGHKADLNDTGQTTLEGEKKGDLLTICVGCWQFVRVKRHMKLNEYLGIPTAVIPDEPQF